MLKMLTRSLIFSLLIFAACQKSDAPADQDENLPEIAPTKRACASQEVLEAQMAADPALRARIAEIERFTEKMILSGQAGRLVNGVIEIPVVVHVLYNTTAQNISPAQVQSQIDVLNEDFNNTNADRTKVPAEFTDEQTSVGIRFVLEQTIRVQTKVRSWSTNDAMKNSKRGGSDAITPSTHLNMWACNLGQGLLGYAQFPGGNPATDGVVVLYSAFGSRAKAAGTYVNAYDLGRTATHEVGHYLNLRHIWGDATCGTDYVNDTPTAHGANYGCPGTIEGCAANTREMTMNYMDYTDDLCMYMFSNGQKGRITPLFATGGARAEMGK
jgi:hypothetical protein